MAERSVSVLRYIDDAMRHEEVDVHLSALIVMPPAAIMAALHLRRQQQEELALREEFLRSALRMKEIA